MAEKMRREMMQGEEEEYEELMKNEAGKQERTYPYNKVERAEYRQNHGKMVYFIDFPETWTSYTSDSDSLHPSAFLHLHTAPLTSPPSLFIPYPFHFPFL